MRVSRLLFVAALTLSVGLGGCELVLGLGDVVNDAGVEAGARDGSHDVTLMDGPPSDSPMDSLTLPMDSSSDACHVRFPETGTCASDAGVFDAGFCNRLLAKDAGVLFCDDFDTPQDGGASVPFDGGFFYDKGELNFVNSTECVSPPTCIYAEVPASDASSVTAYVMEDFIRDASAIPSYIAVDVLVPADCAVQPAGAYLQILSLELGDGANAVHVAIQTVMNNLELLSYTFFAPDGSVFPAPAMLPMELGSWVRMRLDFQEGCEGQLFAQLSVGSPGNNDRSCLAPIGFVPVAQPPPEAGPYDIALARVRLGLNWGHGSTPACKVNYDNFVVGPYAN